MVKGTTHQVIVVHSPEPKLFEQAIFILRDEAANIGVTDEMLLREAEQAIHTNAAVKKRKLYLYGAFWAGVGALFTGIIWIISLFL